MKKPSAAGGWHAIKYTFSKAREVGGRVKLWKAMRSKMRAKRAALGMGGQKGGMVNERGNFPEVCKKSLQAMASDLQGAIKPEFLEHLFPPATREAFRRGNWKRAAGSCSQ